MISLRLYVREDCHLCEDMLYQLKTLQIELNFTLEIRDVDSNPLWLKNYHEWVPVLKLGDQEICHYHLDLHALKRALEFT